MTQKSKLNFVAENQIWKDHVETENIAARRWPQRWGFMLTPVEELLKDEKKPPAKPKIPLPEHLQIRPVTPVETYIKGCSPLFDAMLNRQEEAEDLSEGCTAAAPKCQPNCPPSIYDNSSSKMQ
ncbi:ciliary microtubule inner protein 1 isoform X2 [Podarcis muralis]